MKANSVRVLIAVAFSAALSFTAAFANDIPQSKQTTAGLYLTAVEAAAMLEADDTVFIDVRSRSEVAFLGLPVRVDKNIPYMDMPLVPEFDAEKGAYTLELNPDFPLQFTQFATESGVTADTPIILMCRSGSRSAKAADLLTQMGYTQVYSVIDGYEGDKAGDGDHKGQRVINGWRNAGLPWSYRIRPDQAYPADL